jgi:uncharacterized protein
MIPMRQFAKLVVLQLLRAYKWAISPMFPPACRYVPTCSDYAMEAVDRYGALRGSGMTFLRLLRCHPLARGGYDPVVKIIAGYEGVTNFPQRLKPHSYLEADAALKRRSSTVLPPERCATQNPKPGNLNYTDLTHGAI